MKKYVVLSTNWNPDYLYYTPLVVWAWRKLGWEPLLFYEGEKTGPLVYVLEQCNLQIAPLALPPGYRSDTVTQVSRLYGCCLVEDGYLMTGDIDMIPLSNYWKPNFEDNGVVTIWGHDLTGYTHYPICYIGAHAGTWRKIMNTPTAEYDKYIARDLDTMPQAKDPDFYKYWFTDQDLVTGLINKSGFRIEPIMRGQLPNGYAVGRVDRGDWTLNHERFIDCHAKRDMYKNTDTGFKNLSDTLRMLDRVWPEENFTWFQKYTQHFQRLANNG